MIEYLKKIYDYSDSIDVFLTLALQYSSTNTVLWILDTFNIDPIVYKWMCYETIKSGNITLLKLLLDRFDFDFDDLFNILRYCHKSLESYKIVSAKIDEGLR